ncbi:hypothetical protein EDB19DRAFT_1825583 [Suillus lakei]|nr:hypothetical protein EDB19DRAFT_1825583 [Suillus lakei]
MLRTLSLTLAMFLLMLFYFISHQEDPSLVATALMNLAIYWLLTRQKFMSKSSQLLLLMMKRILVVASADAWQTLSTNFFGNIDSSICWTCDAVTKLSAYLYSNINILNFNSHGATSSDAANGNHHYCPKPLCPTGISTDGWTSTGITAPTHMIEHIPLGSASPYSNLAASSSCPTLSHMVFQKLGVVQPLLDSILFFTYHKILIALGLEKKAEDAVHKDHKLDEQDNEDM